VKTLIEDPVERTQVPFLRGILTRSLQNAGIGFEDAYRIATRIRRSLSHSPVISTAELRRRVEAQLRSEGLEPNAHRYKSLEAPTMITIIGQDGQPAPYSSALHQRSLEAIGLGTEEAMATMLAIRSHLVSRHLLELSSRHLAKLTYRHLRKSSNFGPSVAHRWLVWSDFVHSGRPLVFLIGGTSGCGKSTIATALANRLNIVRMQSTDMLREVMRTMISERLLPVLHASSFAAWNALGYRETRSMETHEEILARGYRTQADLLSAAIEAVCERALRERVSLIVEGVHVHPGLARSLPCQKNSLVIPVMLGLLKRQSLQSRIKGRGKKVPDRRAQRYLDNFEDIWGLQTYLLSEADRANIPIVINDDTEVVLREITRITIEKLSAQFDADPSEVFG
jgi:2-phosphoglycerate kinase